LHIVACRAGAPQEEGESQKEDSSEEEVNCLQGLRTVLTVCVNVATVPVTLVLAI